MMINKESKYFGLLIFGILLLVNWIANYSGLAGFGLYEDDYWYVANSLNHNTGDLFSFLGDIMGDFEKGEGRLIGKSLPLILIHFIYNTAGFKALFVAGFLLVTVNATILFSLMRRNYNPVIGILAALLFLVFPTDTTRPFLTHIYQLQLSLLFTLTAFIFLEKRLYFFAYLFGLFSLLTYENAFLPFVFAPFLLISKWDKKFWKAGIWHLAICAALVIGIFVMRKLGGETRVASLSMTDFAKKTLASTIVGPVFALYSLVVSSFESLRSLANNLPAILGGSAVSFVALYWLNKQTIPSGGTRLYNRQMTYFNANLEINETLEQFIRLFVVSGLMMMVGYLFSYTHYPPSVIKGRMASVHFATTVSGAIFIANILYLVLFLIKKYRIPAITAIALFLGLQCGYSNLIQREYKDGWKAEQVFWKDASTLVKDAGEGTMILVQHEDLDSTVSIQAHSWSVPLVLSESYRFPESWEYQPRVKKFRTWKEFEYDSVKNSVYFVTDYPFMFENRDTIYLEDYKTVLLDKVNGTWTRKADSLALDGHTVYLQPVGASILDTVSFRKLGKIVFSEKKE